MSTTGSHTVPEAKLTNDPVSGPGGTKVTIKGIGFRRFVNVEEMKVGSLDIRPSPIPNTDDAGSFTAIVIMPQTEVGVQTMTVKAGQTSASVPFEVKEGAAPVVSAKPAEALKPLVDAKTLVRVWGYNAATQTFQLYDPAAALLSDLTLLISGEGYWIRVTDATTLTVGIKTLTLTKGWNLKGWP